MKVFSSNLRSLRNSQRKNLILFVKVVTRQKCYQNQFHCISPSRKNLIRTFPAIRNGCKRDFPPGIDGRGRKEKCRKKKQENVEEDNVEFKNSEKENIE